MMAELQLSLLGGVQIKLDGEPVSGFVSSKVQALLCYLVVTERSHTRAALAGIFWGSVPPSDARTSLRKALSNLRKLVGDHLHITRKTAALAPDAHCQVDVARFTALLEQFRQGDGGFSLLRDAAACYQGDFLEGFFVDDAPAFMEWAVAERERLRQQALHALQQVADHYVRQGAYGDAIRYTGRLLALAPWREAAYRQMMRLLAYNRQYGEALAQYQTCRANLQRELGVDPMPETVALYERIQAARTRRPPQAPVSAALIGRSRELADLDSLLHNPDCRLITIVGPGGIGKTRLAWETAVRHHASYLEGVAMVPLAAVATADLLAPAIANALDLALYGPSNRCWTISTTKRCSSCWIM